MARRNRDPTPEQIARLTEEIRREWSEAERQTRRTRLPYPDQENNESRYDDTIGPEQSSEC